MVLNHNKEPVGKSGFYAKTNKLMYPMRAVITYTYTKPAL